MDLPLNPAHQYSELLPNSNPTIDFLCRETYLPFHPTPPGARLPTRNPSEPASSSRHSLAKTRKIAPASSTCAGFRPNIIHFPRRDRRSESQRKGRAKGVRCRRVVLAKVRLFNSDSLQLDREDMKLGLLFRDVFTCYVNNACL